MVLRVSNLSLPLKYTPTGPLLSTQDEYFKALAWIVNPAVTGRRPQLADKFARGEDVVIKQRYAVRPTPEDNDLDEARARWHGLTGEEPSEDVYILGTGFTSHEVVLPRKTLLDIIQALKKLRAEFPEPPFPWLFRLDAYHPSPTEGEKEFIQELEKRAVAIKEQQKQTCQTALQAKQQTLLRDLEAAGVFSSAYSEKKQLWLEIWKCPTLLTYHKDTMRFLNHFRNHLHPPVAQSVPLQAMLGASISISAQPLLSYIPA